MGAPVQPAFWFCSRERTNEKMHKLKAALVGLLCLVAISGCTTNTNPGDVKFTTVATLQLAVGTINDTASVLEDGACRANTLPACHVAPPGHYLNAVSTFRNQAGNSAFINPGTATLIPGNGPSNIGTLFSYGQSPGVNGTVAQGPAFAAPGTGTGYMLDITLGVAGHRQLPPIPGGPTTYTLSTDVPVNGGLQHFSASATLASGALLALVANPAYVADGLGGGTLTCVAAPAGVEQAMMVLNGATITSGILGVVECPAGATVTVVPDGTFPTGAASAFMIDADYPFVEAGPVNAPAVGTATPLITNGAASPQADMVVGGYFPITL
jgi:hypothetical protein